jgi:hypothetical protein
MKPISVEMEQAVVDAISSTMEDMAFEQIERISEADARALMDAPCLRNDPNDRHIMELSEGLQYLSQSIEQIWAALSLIDPIQGEITIEVPRQYAAQMTEELFGPADEQYSEDLLRDTLAEVLNTMAGLFVKALIPSYQEYSLGLPATGCGDTVPKQTQSQSYYFDLSGQVMTVSLMIDAPIEFEDLKATEQEVLS